METCYITALCLVLVTLTSFTHALFPLLLSSFFIFHLLSFMFQTLLMQNRLPTPPGPTGWPIIGSIPIMGTLAHRKLALLANKFNANHLMSLNLGFTPVVISSHPDTAKQILSSLAFADRPLKTSARLLMFERAIGFAPSGEYWRHLRRICSTNIFSPRRIRESESLRQRVCDEMIKRVGDVMVKEGKVVLRDVLQNGSLDSVIGCVVGKKLNKMENIEIVELVREGYELIGMFDLEDHVPLGGLLDINGVGRRFGKLAARVRVFFCRIMEERRLKEGGIEQNNDLLSVLMSLSGDDRLCDSDVIAVLWEMIFRGTDVVAILIEWIMARLILHPNIQSRAQEEILATVGNRSVTDSDIPKLHYLQAIVKEVLRMHPPGPLLSWARLATQDVHIGKFIVPAGTTAMVNMWAITHDGSIWSDPWDFKPERFIEKDVSVMGSDLRLAPFGSGHRVCPGRVLGLTTVHLWVARFLQEYDWVSGRPVNLSECLRLSMEMKKPLVCKLYKR